MSPPARDGLGILRMTAMLLRTGIDAHLFAVCDEVLSDVLNQMK